MGNCISFISLLTFIGPTNKLTLLKYNDIELLVRKFNNLFLGATLVEISAY